MYTAAQAAQAIRNSLNRAGLESKGRVRLYRNDYITEIVLTGMADDERTNAAVDEVIYSELWDGRSYGINNEAW